MRSLLLAALLALVPLVTPAGCASDDPARACTPGATQVCNGPGACVGAQSCNDEGSGYGACACGTAGSGGAAGGALAAKPN